MKMKRRRDEERARDIRSMKREREREEIFSYKDKDKRAETHTSSSSSSTLILGPREAVRFSVTMATNPWPKKQRIVGRFSFFFFFGRLSVGRGWEQNLLLDVFLFLFSQLVYDL